MGTGLWRGKRDQIGTTVVVQGLVDDGVWIGSSTNGQKWTEWAYALEVASRSLGMY